jgi:predicted dehydrogenase
MLSSSALYIGAQNEFNRRAHQFPRLDRDAMDIAIVGCGFVSYLYGGTLHNYPDLRVRGVYDCDAERAKHWCKRFGASSFESLEELLDSSAEIVVNLTNPRSHFEVTSACLQAGKHVYTEKPVATRVSQVRELASLAQRQGLLIGCAPCSLLGEAAQTLWHAIKSGTIGRVHTAHVALCVPGSAPELAADWVASHRNGGLAATTARMLDFPVTWPYADEHETGPAYEHAAYPLKWLTSWFGSVERIVNYSASRMPRRVGWDYLRASLLEIDTSTSDFYVSCLSLQDDVEVLLINSSVTSDDFRFVLHGESGSLEIANQWDFASPVWVTRRGIFMPPLRSLYPHTTACRFTRRYPRGYRLNMDYARGIAELSRSIRQGCPSAHTPDLAQEVHVQEVTDCIARTPAGVVVPLSTFVRRPVPLPLPHTVGVGVIGTGDAGAYLPELTASDHCTVIELAGTRARDALCDSRVDVVINLTELPERAAVTRSCLQAGKHVFSEQPPAATLAEATAILNIAHETGLRVGCAASALMRSPAQCLAEGLRAGLLGSLERIECVTRSRAGNNESSWRLVARCERLSHWLWLSTWIAGPVWRVRANKGTGTRSHVTAQLQFGRGTRMEARWYTRPDEGEEPEHIEFHGTAGRAWLEQDALHLLDSAGNPTVWTERATSTSPLYVAHGAIEFCASICEARPHRHSLEHATHQLEIWDLLRTSASCGREITVQSPHVRGTW